jgi:predicted GNAT family N-acyltransferase
MDIKVLRATEPWQQAGAYYVRIQGMARQHGITLRQEFDELDNADMKYIVLLDGEFPVATCRLFETENKTAKIGRVVVLPEYRKKGLGRRVLEEAEKWLKELGIKRIEIDSRDVAVGFYEKLGYTQKDGKICQGEPFDCVKMEKNI